MLKLLLEQFQFWNLPCTPRRVFLEARPTSEGLVNFIFFRVNGKKSLPFFIDYKNVKQDFCVLKNAVYVTTWWVDSK